MSDCKLCGLPPCTCRCGLVRSDLRAWRGVLKHLAAAQLHAERIAVVTNAWQNCGPRLGNSRTRIALQVMGKEPAL